MLKNIGKIAEELGIILLGVTSPGAIEKEEGRLKTWLKNGYEGEMAYLRKPNLCYPSTLFPDVRSIISFAVPYKKRNREYRKGYGQVARYAFGEDYHRVVPRLAKQLLDALGISGSVYSDAVPVLEKPLAASAGLGFMGKNTLLIRPGVGSYFLLGEILTSEEIEHTVGAYKGCGTCSRCITDCPTGAIVEPHTLDARKCISYLTIEKGGFLSIEERSMIGEWIFGCDICQEVCPFNHGDGDDLASIRLEEVLSIGSNREFEARYGTTAFSRARRSGLLRNALYVAVNQGFDQILPLIESLAQFDESPIVRLSAVWAARELGSGGWEGFFEKARRDEKISTFIHNSGMLG